MLSLASKMTDSMKFGPEWLRNLSQENSSSSGNGNNSSSSSSTMTSSTTTTTTTSMPRFQLAEHRYGREEMLALFDSSVVAPESLKQINALYIEKTQTPLLLLQWTEEETRTWNRGINSDAVLRLAGKGGQGPGGPSVGNSGSIRGGLGGGRGGSMDRGRGRGRGFHYNRGLSYDESDGNSGPPSSYSRSIRSFDRDRMQGDRSSSWTERNGDMESSSPRKDFGNSGREMSWRRHQEDESWRTTRHDKWVRGGGSSSGGGLGGNSSNTNWREDWDREPNHRSDNSRTRLWDEPNPNRPWDSDDNLPEWATEKPSESGGSFDASGAFHGTNSDDDEESANSRVTKQKSRDEDGHRSDISTNNRVPSSNHPESNGTERHMNGPVTHTDRLESNSKRVNKDKSPHDLSSGPPPLRQSHSTSSISNSSPPTRKTSAPSQQAQENAHAHPLTTSTSLSGMPVSKKVESPEPEKVTSPPSQPVVEAHVRKQQTSLPPPPQLTQRPMQIQPHSLPAPVLPPVSVPTPAPSLSSNKPEDTAEPEGMKLMQEVVAKLVDVDDSLHAHSKPVPQALPRALDNSDQWFYTDPQGEVQGPFSSAEMSEWYRSGYFSLNLMVRRADEQKFAMLGDQMKKYGKIPFIAESPTAAPAPAIPAMPEPAPVPPAARQNSVVEEALLFQQLQFQNFVIRQQQQAMAAKALVQPDWNSLTPDQQLLMRASLEQSSFQPIPTLPPNVPAPAPAPIPPTTENSVGAAILIQKLKQAQAQAQAQQQQQQQQAQQQQQQQQQQHHQLQHHQQHQQQHPQPLQEQPQQLVGGDPLLAGAVPRAHPQQIPPKGVEEEARGFEPLVSFLCQLQQNMAMKQVDSVWSGPNPAAAAAAAAAAQQMSNWGTMTPLWGDVQPKMKTEQEILEEQRAEEVRKKEELRKQVELNMKLKLKEEVAAAEEERKRRKRAEEEEAEKKRKEEEAAAAAERKRKKEEEEAKRKEAAAKKAELERKKEEEKRRKEEEKKRKEEEKRKQEEEKRRLEEEKKKHEEERKRKEEENRRTEQARKQAEALKRLQEQAKVSPPWAPPPPPSTSLSEILKTERKQQQQLREQQLQQQHQQQQQQQLQYEAQARNQSNSKIQLKWAEQKLPTKVKSLAEIQAEEQENLIAKQVEKEKERSISGVTTTGSIWSGQNLTWSNNSNPISAWGNSTAATGSSSAPGFWEEVSSVPKSQPKANSKSVAPVQPKNVVGKTKTKKEEAVVMKLFEQAKPRTDEFFLWCTKALTAMQSDLDIPTFVTFLRDIESEYEVREYVKMYLGEGKEPTEFAAQFIERRTKMSRPSRAENNTSVPALTPTNHFQEVKGKSKKPKKNKMLRVDNRILGFNVTAAHDRINVGDRDYGDGV